MEIEQKKDGSALTIALTGCLDTVTSPDLQSVIDGLDGDITDLTLDFGKLSYISSAGLRVLLMANRKLVAASGKMRITGASPAVRDVFDMTGFSDIFTIA